jgi:hypothetical protein
VVGAKGEKGGKLVKESAKKSVKESVKESAKVKKDKYTFIKNIFILPL